MDREELCLNEIELRTLSFDFHETEKTCHDLRSMISQLSGHQEVP